MHGKISDFCNQILFLKMMVVGLGSPSPVLLSVMTGDACTFDMQNQILLTNLLTYLIFAFLYLQTQLYIEK